MNLFSTDNFANRHIGPSEEETKAMLEIIGVDSIDTLIDQTIPKSIRLPEMIDIPQGISEFDYTVELRKIASKNEVFRSYIGLGYADTIVPPVIQRNILENPGWYTQYTPYQAEISQGRLEALLNFQTMLCDLTGLELANASLLDEGTAAAEAMIMLHNVRNKRVKGQTLDLFLVDENCLPQTLDILRTRSAPLGIEIKISAPEAFELNDQVFGFLLQYPGKNGEVKDYTELIAKAHEQNIFSVVAADLLSLTLIKSPGDMGADVAVGNTQRFGVPLGFGGPHAAYFSTHETFKRNIPGRIIGVSQDSAGRNAYRMALQTREQHIKREKATSNICTAQALLAIMAGMYAVWHGPEGLKNIASRIHLMTGILSLGLQKLGYKQLNKGYFDTLSFDLGETSKEKVHSLAIAKGINLCYGEGNQVSINLGETVRPTDLHDLLDIFATAAGKTYTPINLEAVAATVETGIPTASQRTSEYLQHPIFNSYRSETDMMRYIKKLENRDLSLTQSMIPLGSCTMKLNAAVELMPVSWPEFNSVHPFAPNDQVMGYNQMLVDLEGYLSRITGFAATSLQPNSGAQGEYAGLLVIKAYHEDRGDFQRNVTLIPSSAHGTNPASAVMTGMKVVVVKCDERGNIDVEDLKEKAEKYKETLSALMVTYPSTHGVFEESIRSICEIIHENGGLVYMDGANMNAQVGFTSPAMIGADVCHLNLHKTFAIPHGGGGPGMGPICVNEKLMPFLPGHPLVKTGGEKGNYCRFRSSLGKCQHLIDPLCLYPLIREAGV